ncbi:DUF2247 family protein [Undibacterium sp. Ji50W]|uniref:DUF2247 family protein n=1 Tax=Undibacterium sp. Ji50W TaxID=3413041 RepID=UPI003BEF990E
MKGQQAVRVAHPTQDSLLNFPYPSGLHDTSGVPKKYNTNIPMIEKIYVMMDGYNFIDWGVLLLGISGIPGIDDHLQVGQIEGFAKNKLSFVTSHDLLFDVIAGLAIGSNATSAELRDTLEKICQSKEINMDDARRKWRLVGTEYMLSVLDPDPVYGLIELSGFWSAWGWPSDAPFQMRNHKNHLSSEEYHSQQNFKKIITEHQKWLEMEHALFAYMQIDDESFKQAVRKTHPTQHSLLNFRYAAGNLLACDSSDVKSIFRLCLVLTHLVLTHLAGVIRHALL